MSDYKNLVLTREGEILTITINRPDSLNALNTATIEELGRAFEDAQTDGETRGIILTGAGDKAFVAGADIKEINQLNAMNGRKFSETGQEVFKSIEECEIPVVAAINGFALGGGCELAMACHLRVASESAKFGLPEASLGLIPAYGGTQRLPNLIGKGRALELMMTGKMIDANLARSYGLVNTVVPAIDLLDAARKLLSTILKQAPLSLSNIIHAVNAVGSEENGYQTEANGFLNCCGTEDFKEGTNAFIQKRKPEFKGE